MSCSSSRWYSTPAWKPRRVRSPVVAVGMDAEHEDPRLALVVAHAAAEGLGPPHPERLAGERGARRRLGRAGGVPRARGVGRPVCAEASLEVVVLLLLVRL